jgi:hypothetical protein
VGASPVQKGSPALAQIGRQITARNSPLGFLESGRGHLAKEAASVGGLTSGQCGPVHARAHCIGRFGLKVATS